jgi:hypothetical protein
VARGRTTTLPQSDRVGTEPPFDSEKLEHLVLYLAARSFDDPHFTNAKLNRLLFYADFMAYAVHGAPITGAPYVRQQAGPAPQGMAQIRERLARQGRAVNVVRPHYAYEQKRLVPLREADLNRFTARELELINRVVELLRDGDAVPISEWSHLETGWRLAHVGQPIPYCAAFLSGEGPNEDDVRWGQELTRELGLATP